MVKESHCPRLGFLGNKLWIGDPYDGVLLAVISGSMPHIIRTSWPMM